MQLLMQAFKVSKIDLTSMRSEQLSNSISMATHPPSIRFIDGTKSQFPYLRSAQLTKFHAWEWSCPMAVIIEPQLDSKLSFLAKVPEGGEARKAFVRENRQHINSLLCGMPIPYEVMPRKSILQTTREPTHGFFTCGAGIAVDDRVVNAVEDFEPSVHQFHPIELFLSDGTPVQRQHYVMNCCTSVEAVNWRESDIHLKIFDQEAMKHRTVTKAEFQELDLENVRFRFSLKPSKPLVLLKSEIEGRAMWFDPKIEKLFFSDALFDRIVAEGVEGWRSFPSALEK